MEKHGRTRALRMSLMELSIMISIFAVVSVLLTRMYVEADRLQGNATQISKSIVLCETVAEAIKGSEALEPTMSNLGFQMTEDKAAYQIQYDKEWNVSLESNAFQLRVNPVLEERGSGKMLTAVISATTKAGEELCTLTVKRFYPETGKE